MCLLGVYLAVYQSIIGTISKEYSTGSAAMGLIISLHFIGSIIAPVIFGEISDRKGKKPVTIMAFVLVVAGLLSVFIFKNLIIISAGIFIIGCGFAIIEGNLAAVVAEVNTDNSGQAMNFTQMFFSLGAVFGPLISMFLIKSTGSWKSIFLVLIVAFTFVAAYISGPLPGKSSGQAETINGLITLKLLKNKMFILLCISLFAYVGIEEGMAFWFGAYFNNYPGHASGTLGAYTLSGYWGIMILGRYLASRMHNSYNLFLKGGLVLAFCSIIIALLFKGSAVSAVFFVLSGLGFSAVWPIIVTITAISYPEYNSTAMGIMMTSGAGGGAVVPLLTGVVTGYAGVELAFCIFPVIILLILLALTGIRIPTSKTDIEN